MSEIKVEMCKKYRTRDGRDVRVICIDAEGGLPVIALVKGPSGGTEDIRRLQGDGRRWSFEESMLDLIEISPYEDWPMDAPVWASQTGNSWVPRHFAGVDFDGRALIWPDGYSSHTTLTRDKIRWEHVRLASEFNPYKKDM